MAALDIQIGNPSVLSRIESFMNDSSYREAIENSANYNTRLCIERRMRLPFLDPQTGIAQNHSHLFMSAKHRMPGLEQGQVYTYPSKRWRKKRRQYLMQMPDRRKNGDVENSDLHMISAVENPAVANSEDSKDSLGVKEEATAKVAVSKNDSWYYDELDLQAMDGFDDQDPDSDYDYEETYTKKRKRRGGSTKQTKQPVESTKKAKAATPSRGRKKGMQYAADPNDTDKPFSCDLCGARYKTRPGLTYHYTHSHKEGKCATTTPAGEEESSASGENAAAAVAAPPPTTDPPLPPPLVTEPQYYQDGYLTYLNTPG